jgi:hypothetical protein
MRITAIDDAMTIAPSLAPSLACHLCMGTLDRPTSAHSGPRATGPALYEAIREAGFTGVQGGDAAQARAAGLDYSGMVCTPDCAGLEDALAAERDRGARVVAMHIGTGLEDDHQALGMLERVVAACERLGITGAVETHRATVTQDMQRTVGFVRRLPGLRFNADMSHWYCGQEMVYGDWQAKLAFIAPVLERVRFIHGRIAEPGCIQAERIDDGQPHVAHFRELWSLAMAGFRRTARPDEVLIFAPELLPADISYARADRRADGTLVERHDRWADALRLCRIARDCWKP